MRPSTPSNGYFPPGSELLYPVNVSSYGVPSLTTLTNWLVWLYIYGEILNLAMKNAQISGAKIYLTHDAKEAVSGADVVSLDRKSVV